MNIVLTVAKPILFAAMTAVVSAEPLPRLEKGKDRIEVPAIGPGLCLHNLFQSNMVIQRDKPIRIWGWASPRESVTVTIGSQKQSTQAAVDRTWSVSFPAMAANSNPAPITVRGTSKNLTLENCVIGDVWILGGQSNMEHPLSRCEDGDLEIASAHHPGIRILTVPAQNGPELKNAFARLDEWHSFFGQHYRKGDWDVCSPKIVEELSCIGYAFARRIHMASQIPIGVIDISRGGTCLETWLPADIMRATATSEVKTSLAEWDAKVANFDPQKDLETRIRQHHEWVDKMKKQGKEIPADRVVPETPIPGPGDDMNRPGNCYASMVGPLAGFAVKGAIWHQGYNNALQPEGHMMYCQLFGKMIESWRTAFNDPKMPFGIISLCTEGPQQNLENFTEMMVNEGPYIRQVQYQTFLDYERAGDHNIGFASSYDMRRSWYHPQLKIPVGERIARWALATQYGTKIEWRPPLITGVKAGDGRITLTFDMAVDGLSSFPIEGFAIAGKSRSYHPATATHRVIGKEANGQPQKDFKTLELTSRQVPEPQHYRYAWGRNPMGNLLPRSAGGSRTPLATQRSDDWRIHETPVRFADSAASGTLNLARETGRLIDMDRRLKEAQRLLDDELQKHTIAREKWNARWSSKPE